MLKIERIIWNLRPVRFVVAWSKQFKPPGFQGLPLYDVIRFFMQQVRQVGINERAAAISFNFLMAIPPLGIFLFTVLSNLPWSRRLYTEALSLTRNITPDDHSYSIIQSLMNDFFESSGSFLSLGLIFAIYFSSNAMITIMRTFNKSILHIETEKRNFLKLRWEAIKLTVMIVALILGSILLIFMQGSFYEWIRKWLGFTGPSLALLFQLLRLTIIFLMVFYAIALIYRFAPSVQKKWRLNSPGAILATVMIILFSFLFSYWVNNIAAYNKIYGSLGSVLILMLLVFVNSLVLLIGFELNVSINSLRSLAMRRKEGESEILN